MFVHVWLFVCAVYHTYICTDITRDVTRIRVRHCVLAFFCVYVYVWWVAGGERDVCHYVCVFVGVFVCLCWFMCACVCVCTQPPPNGVNSIRTYVFVCVYVFLVCVRVYVCIMHVATLGRVVVTTRRK